MTEDPSSRDVLLERAELYIYLATACMLVLAAAALLVVAVAEMVEASIAGDYDHQQRAVRLDRAGKVDLLALAVGQVRLPEDRHLVGAGSHSRNPWRPLSRMRIRGERGCRPDRTG